MKIKISSNPQLKISGKIEIVPDLAYGISLELSSMRKGGTVN